jgi:hypothetical protein
VGSSNWVLCRFQGEKWCGLTHSDRQAGGIFESIYPIGPGEGNTSQHRVRTSTKFFTKLEYLREEK